MKGLDLMPFLKKTIHESNQILKQNPLAAHFIPPAAPAEEPAEEPSSAPAEETAAAPQKTKEVCVLLLVVPVVNLQV